jgi:hypothetical protein
MPVPYFRVILPVMALALSTAGVASATTINLDNSPVGQNSSTGSFWAAIDGDYGAFGNSSPLFAGGAFDGDGRITLSFEVTSGYAPDTRILRAIRALIGRR